MNCPSWCNPRNGNRFSAVLWMVALHVLLCSCSMVSGNAVPLQTASPDIENSAYLKIISKGIDRSEKGRTDLSIKYIQYTIDGNLLGAHDLRMDYENRIALTPGKHVLHVERLQRGILSAQALILDQGDCYEFILEQGQTGLFQGQALPGRKWDSDGFRNVRSWKKLKKSPYCAY